MTRGKWPVADGCALPKTENSVLKMSTQGLSRLFANLDILVRAGIVRVF